MTKTPRHLRLAIDRIRLAARTTLAVAAVLGVGVTNGAAQAVRQPTPAEEADAKALTELSLGPIVPFLESTDVFWTLASPPADRGVAGNEYKPPFVIEANLFPHLIFWQTYSDVLEAKARPDSSEVESGAPRRERETSIAVSGTPGVRLRMLTANSRPVRTPTFTPRVDVQLLKPRGLKARVRELQNEGDAGAAERRGGTIGLYEVHLKAAHYSNGQEGCVSVLQTRATEDPGDCEPPEPALSKDTVNRSTGNFSTNFIAVGMNYTSNRIDAKGVEVENGVEWRANREIRLAAEVELHSNELSAYYSNRRANWVVALAYRNRFGCSRRLEVAASGTIGLDDKIRSNSAAQIQASCFFSRSKGGLGLFARAYRGQDYYNVQFLEHIPFRLHVGVTYTQAGFFRFLVPNTGAKGNRAKDAVKGE